MAEDTHTESTDKDERDFFEVTFRVIERKNTTEFNCIIVGHKTLGGETTELEFNTPEFYQKIAVKH